MRDLILFALLFSAACAPVRLLHAWTLVEYTEPTPEEVRMKAPLAGVDLDRRGNIYLTTPRWLDARVPQTLSKLVLKDDRPVLEPFPSQEANMLGDPRALQSVLGVEIDSKNRMWILDMGFVAGGTEVLQKLVVWDIDGGKEIARYEIPDEVADRKTSFLNDLAIDEKRGLAYISDSGNRSGSPTASGIIIYDLTTNTAKRVLDRHPSVQDDASRTLMVDDEPVFEGDRLAVGINGIALSPDGARLYWSITTGDAIYWADTQTLRAGGTEIGGPHRIGGGSDGISVDDRGHVYITDLAHNRVLEWDPKTDTTRTLVEGKLFAWPDSMSWDARGGLYVTTNHLNHAFAGKLRPGDVHYRIWRIQTDAGGKGFVR